MKIEKYEKKIEDMDLVKVIKKRGVHFANMKNIDLLRIIKSDKIAHNQIGAEMELLSRLE